MKTITNHEIEEIFENFHKTIIYDYTCHDFSSFTHEIKKGIVICVPKFGKVKYLLEKIMKDHKSYTVFKAPDSDQLDEKYNEETETFFYDDENLNFTNIHEFFKYDANKDTLFLLEQRKEGSVLKCFRNPEFYHYPTIIEFAKYKKPDTEFGIQYEKEFKFIDDDGIEFTDKFSDRELECLTEEIEEKLDLYIKEEEKKKRNILIQECYDEAFEKVFERVKEKARKERKCQDAFLFGTELSRYIF